MTQLLDILNASVHLTPDEIAAKVGDPLSLWRSISTFMTPENYERHRDRQICMLEFSLTRGLAGLYTSQRDQMTSAWSYRTMNVDAARPDTLRDYNPRTAQDCGGWWFIGWEHRHTPFPLVPADPSHATYPDEDDYEPDPDFDEDE